MISGVGTHDYKEPMQEEVWYTPQLTKVAYRHGSSLWRPCCRAGSGEQQHQEEKEGRRRSRNVRVRIWGPLYPNYKKAPPKQYR